MKKLEPQARNAYSEDPTDMDSNDFALMLLLDGCFVVWTIISRSLRDGGLEDLQNPIDSKPWPLPVVAQDMLILENQLPFFLLEHLYDFANFRGHSSTNSTSLAVLAFEFFRIFLNLKMKMPSNIEGRQFHHLLHLVHSCISPPENQDGGESSTGSRWGEEYGGASFLWIPTATQLMHSGVYPCRKMYAANILDITFDYENIRIPPVEVDHTSNRIFGNLIAFEQCNEDMNPHFTAYAIAMDCMVHTAFDATLLEDRGIITNSWGDSKEVPKFFNNLCKGVMIDMNRYYLLNVFTHIKKHRSKKYNTWMARLNRDYFSSPWAGISFVEAVVLLFIGIIETIYTVLQYLKSK
ncbi:UPF0481 protein [Canna indica]|uniref:UPF0481 protein n=1 Tax=Canna indica TaxID=4628 RepID=A0AAQ3KCV1_9LILI|nr:UPF0481 protein [Canna indica]